MAETVEAHRAGIVAKEMLGELERARNIHPTRMRSTHEGYGILIEEIEELFDAIKANDFVGGRKEAIQCGAMLIALVDEVYDAQPSRDTSDDYRNATSGD